MKPKGDDDELIGIHQRDDVHQLRCDNEPHKHELNELVLLQPDDVHQFGYDADEEAPAKDIEDEGDDDLPELDEEEEEKLKNDEVFLPREFRVIGELYIGHQQLDSSTIYGTVRAAQDLYGLGKGVHGIYVRVKDGENEHAVVARLNATTLPPAMRAFSWMESWEDFLWVLNLEKSINFFLRFFLFS